MKLLWITNIPFPATNKLLGRTTATGGGWMASLASELTEKQDVSLAIATIYDGKGLFRHEEDGIQYYLLPQKKPKYKYDSSLEKYWAEIVDQYLPDVIHIHGTEFAHGLACINACPGRRFVISIQGLVSVYLKYFYAGIRLSEYIKHITLNEVRTKNTVFQEKRILKERADIELKYIRGCNNIIGRTFWDYSHVKAINSNVRYHFCNEVLRPIFYEGPRWSIENRQTHTIFMSQAYSQRQGLHKMFQALQIVKKEYPEVHLRVAGIDATGGTKWVQRINSYGAFLRSLIKRLNLKKNITFLGPLKAELMAQEFRNAHVFVCASTIENSPNSLGEAQLLGTPCIASFVGGVPDMVKDGETGLLYRFDDYVVLAYKIIQLFANDDLAKHISQNEVNAALERHNKTTITSKMQEIYKTITEV